MAQEQEEESWPEYDPNAPIERWDPSKYRRDYPTEPIQQKANRQPPVNPEPPRNAEIVSRPGTQQTKPVLKEPDEEWMPTAYGSVYVYYCPKHLLKRSQRFESTLAVSTVEEISALCPRCHPGVKPIEVSVRPELPWTVEIDLFRQGVGRYTALRQPSSLRRKYRLFGVMQALVRLNSMEPELTGSRIVEVRLSYRGKPTGWKADYRHQNLVMKEKLGEVLLRISSR